MIDTIRSRSIPGRQGRRLIGEAAAQGPVFDAASTFQNSFQTHHPVSGPTAGQGCY